ncbi:MAG: L-histidine N(alpha)-methyltransferase, partial [Thermoanaerobaculia bacterium]
HWRSWYGHSPEEPAVTVATEDRIHIEPVAAREDVATEQQRLLAALAEDPPRIPSFYHYDAVGSALFTEITRQPEYYLTRSELALLQRHAPDIAAATRASVLVELGPGDATKTRLLLDALNDRETLVTYAPFDVDHGLLERVARELANEYPELRIHALAGNFLHGLAALPDGERRLVAFLGSTIGNLQPAATVEFVRGLRRQLDAADHFLLGVDLIKDVRRLEAAYNDAAGVTPRFSRNILAALNRRFGFDFEPEAFAHRSVWSAAEHRIETSLVARSPQRIRSEDLDFELDLAAGDPIRTEISTKYDRPIVEAVLAEAGLATVGWLTDPDGSFALALTRRS